MKKENFFILLAVLILSGCSTVMVREEPAVPLGPVSALEQLIRSTENASLTAKDKIKIADGIKTVHSEGNIPDVWRSEKGEEIAVVHQGFARGSDGNYCMTASVNVGGKEFFPPTPLCKVKGVWTVVAEKISAPTSIFPPVKKVTIVPMQIEEHKELVEIKPKSVVPRLEKIRNQPIIRSRKSAEGIREIR